MTSHCQISQNMIIPPWICPRVRPTLLLLRLLHRLLLRFVGSRVVLQQFFLLLVAFWNLGKMTLQDALAHTFTSAKQSMWFQGWVWLMIIAADDFKNLFHNSCFPDPLVPVLVPSLQLKLYFEYLTLSMINSMKKVPDNEQSRNSFRFPSWISRSWPRTAVARGNTEPRRSLW